MDGQIAVQEIASEGLVVGLADGTVVDHLEAMTSSRGDAPSFTTVDYASDNDGVRTTLAYRELGCASALSRPACSRIRNPAPEWRFSPPRAWNTSSGSSPPCTPGCDWVPVGGASACESPMPEDGRRRTSRSWRDDGIPRSRRSVSSARVRSC